MGFRKILFKFLGLFLVLLFTSGAGHTKSWHSSEDTVAYEFIPDVTYQTIEQRLSILENEVPLYLTTKVKAFIDYFTIRNREYTRKAATDAFFFFPIFEKYLKKYNLPDELKYLSIIESGLNPRAISRAGAAGLCARRLPG